MDIKQLKYFAAVVEEGSISSAAKKMHISQPPLSTQIHSLEDEVGCKLFERGARRIRLTEAGNMLYRRAKTLIDMADLAKRELCDYSSGKHGIMRLGIVSSVENMALDLWIKPFHEIYSGVQFEIAEANTYQIIDMLKAGLLELAFVRTPFSFDGMDKIVLKNERMYAVGRKEFFKNTGNRISINEIGGFPLIIYKRWKNILNGIFDELDINPRIVCVNEDARTTAAWADRGMGVGIIPESALEMLRDDEIKSVEIDESRLVTQVCLIAIKNGYRSAIASEFWKHLSSIPDEFQVGKAIERTEYKI